MWVLVAVAALAVVAIAVAAVGTVTARLAATPLLAVFDIEEATIYIADNLPSDVAAKLSHDDVRVLLRWEMTYFRERGVASFGGVDHLAERAALHEGPVVADEDELVDVLLGRALDEGMDANAVDIVCVTDLATDYLLAIGAIGPPVDVAGALPEAPPSGELDPWSD